MDKLFSDKIMIEIAAENMIPAIKEHANLFYNEGWDELVESYSDDEIFNTLCINKITNLDDAIAFFHYRFNPNESVMMQ